MKKILALVLALTLVLASCAVVFADDAPPTGTITISNAAKGIKYNIYKLFDATVGANDAIAYTGTIPDSLKSYFEYVEKTVNNVKESAGTRVTDDKLSDAAVAALKTWTEGATKAAPEQEGTGTTISFTGLPYGYYVITSSQGDKKITVVTLKGAEKKIVDKNTTTVTVGKSTPDKDVYVGQRITYTVEVGTANFMGEGDAAKQVVKYVFEDTLPEYLSNVTIDSVTIDGKAYTPTPVFTNKSFEIPWATGSHNNYTSLYNNGVKIVVTYSATVNENVYVGDANPNRNVITVTPYVDNGDTPGPWEESFHDDEVIYTYGAAIHKVDENDNSLTGAKFAVKGLTFTGSNGKYTVSNYDATSDTYSADMDVDAEGYLYILGLASDVNLTAKETKAPDGYNLATDELTLTPIKMSQTVTYTDRVIKYDAQGKVVYDDVTGGTSTKITANENTLKTEANVLKVVNKTGTELPHTGGIGTTIFYILGGLLVIGAAVVLVARRKAHD